MGHREALAVGVTNVAHALHRALRRAAIALALSALVVVATPALAIWDGPSTVVTATWGSGADQLGLDSGDVPEYDEFPAVMRPAPGGSLVVPDPVNHRVVVYRPDGTRRALVTAQGLTAGAPDWPPGNFVLLGDSFVTQRGSALQRYDLDGALAAELAVDGSMRGTSLDGRIVVEVPGTTHVFDLYSDQLKRVSRLTASPPLAGEVSFEPRRRVEEDPDTGETRRFDDLAIVLPDGEVVLSGVRGTPSYALRDAEGFIYVVTSALDPRDTHTARYPEGTTQSVTIPHPLIQRFDSGGRFVEEMHLPADEWDPVVDANPGDMTEPKPRVLYGGLALSARGDLYLWRRDAAGYQILRWERR
jgi:hypothetical protein